MKKIALWFTGIILLAGCLSPVQAADDVVTDSAGFQVRFLENDVFGPGERMVFEVKYGFVKGGEAGIELMPALITYRGAPCLHIHTWAKSSKTFSKFFKVDDQIHSYMDARGLFSWYFEKHLNEGSYHDLKTVDYDHRNGRAYTTHEGVVKNDNPILPYVQDAISSLYYYRLQPLNVGRSLYVDVYDVHKSYQLRVDVVARETIKVPAGTFRCLKIEPKLESAGIFKSKGRMNIWLTDDQRRIPVLMQTKVLIGSISAELKSYTPGTLVKQDSLLTQDTTLQSQNPGSLDSALTGNGTLDGDTLFFPDTTTFPEDEHP
jgi:hypothetical protein